MPTKTADLWAFSKSRFNRGLESYSAHTEGNTRPASYIRRLRQQQSRFELFHPGDFDSETGEPDIPVTRRCQKTDRGYAEVAQDLRAQADLAPLPSARFFSR